MTTPDRVTPGAMREMASVIELRNGPENEVANALRYAADVIGELLHTCDGWPITDEYQKVWYADVDRVRWTYGNSCEYSTDFGGASYTPDRVSGEPRGTFPCYSTSDAAALAAQQKEKGDG